VQWHQWQESPPTQGGKGSRRDRQPRPAPVARACHQCRQWAQLVAMDLDLAHLRGLGPHPWARRRWAARWVAHLPLGLAAMAAQVAQSPWPQPRSERQALSQWPLRRTKGQDHAAHAAPVHHQVDPASNQLPRLSHTVVHLDLQCQFHHQ